MAETIAELDPGLEVRRRAQESGFYVADYLASRKLYPCALPPTDLIRSDVVCAPADGAVFEPDELNEMLGEIVPTQQDTYFVEDTQGARFEIPSRLRLPVAEIARRIGTYSLRAEVDIRGEESYAVHDTKEIFAKSRVMIAPTRQFAESICGLRIDFVAMSQIDKGTPARQAFKEAAKNHFSWWERFNAR